jgi:hypothetical protein
LITVGDEVDNCDSAVCAAAFDGRANNTTTKAAQNITNDRSDCRLARSVDINSPLALAGLAVGS